MTKFRQFVFFLTTAQEASHQFFGAEKNVKLPVSQFGPELVFPGTYRVQGGALEQVQLAACDEGERLE